MSETTASRPAFLAPFAALEAELARGGPAWLREARRAARQRFEALGFPTTALEEWKSTNPAPIVEAGFCPAPHGGPDDPQALPAGAAIGLGGPRLVFVDGRFVPDLSTPPRELPDGVVAGSLRDAAAADEPELRALLSAPPPAGEGALEALNLALHVDGALVRVAAGRRMTEPLHVVFVARHHPAPSAVHLCNVVAVDRGAEASVVEHYLGPDAGAWWTHAATRLAVEDGARLDHGRLQTEGAGAFHVTSTRARLGRDARLHTLCVDLGARLARNEAWITLDGEGGHCRMHGLYLPRGAQHVDNHTTLEHAKPHCDSRELYKGVLGGAARSVFNGRIIVRPDAQKTDAKQSNPNLLVSGRALAHTRPQLEIYADDVKCTHGATVGRLDEEAVFYLRTRGIPDREARRLMQMAFVQEVLDPVAPPALREHLVRLVAERLREMED